MHNFSLVRCFVLVALSVSGGLVGAVSSRAAESLPPLTEVIEVLKENLTGVTAEELNRSAVTGLLEQLRGRARLEGAGAVDDGGATNAPGLGAKVYDRRFGYVRLAALTTAAGREFEGVLKSLTATNQLKGLVIDLRFAGGADYAAAISVADRFLKAEKPLADWGDGWKKSSTKTDAFTQPVTVLVNARTTGAAEALAGILRHRDVALIVGTNTAGEASRTKLLPLKNGRQLRVAVAPLKVADGTELPRTGLKPDIAVVAASADELAWLADPFKVLTLPVTNALVADAQAAETNRSPRRRINEAELVRMSRDGQTNEREPVAAALTPPEPAAPVLQDTALSRALDVLKGLAVVQQFKSP
jgi:Peptidase family S41